MLRQVSGKPDQLQTAWEELVDELRAEEAKRIQREVKRLQDEMRRTFGEVCDS